MLSRGGEGSVSVVLGSLYSAVSERVVNDEAVSRVVGCCNNTREMESGWLGELRFLRGGRQSGWAT
jgi:hypothetical protein